MMRDKECFNKVSHDEEKPTWSPHISFSRDFTQQARLFIKTFYIVKLQRKCSYYALVAALAQLSHTHLRVDFLARLAIHNKISRFFVMSFCHPTHSSLRCTLVSPETMTQFFTICTIDRTSMKRAMPMKTSCGV